MKLRFLNRLGAHKVACLALFRAILTQCSRIPLTPDQKERLRRFAGKQFRKNRHIDSHRCARAALEIGYEAESILRASAEGNLAETSRILKLVNELPPPPRRSPPIHDTAPAKTERVAPHKPGAPYPGATPVLSRPHRIISRRRHVPILVTCSAGISFLRFKKPQSPYLSRILRTKIKWRQKMTDLKHRLQDEMDAAASEDRWDELLREQHRVGQQHQWKEPTWTACYKKSLEDHTHTMKRFTWRSNHVANRMREIVDRERGLAEAERKERKRAKTERKRKMQKELDEQRHQHQQRQPIGLTRSSETTYEACAGS